MPDIVGGDVPGFARGTRILTEKGELPVEALGPGARVVTAAGGLRSLVWVGRRQIVPRRHPHPDRVCPVRIRRGAIGNGLPHRDLLVSPALVLVLGGLSVTVRELVNGATVASIPTSDAFDYFHVELDGPDLLPVEGLPVESFCDRGNRAAFGNGGGVLVLHPHLIPPEPPAEAIRPALHDLRARLLQRAHALGHAVTRDPGLHLRADGWPLSAALVAGPVHRFYLPAGVADLRIVSRAGVPAELEADSRDRRRLGVKIERIVLRGPEQETEIAPADHTLSEGFHPAEHEAGRSWRWTDGHARLPGDVLVGMRRLDLHIGAFQPAWAGSAPPAAPVTRSA